ncbi:MAG: class I SAM-dependent methyltransferase [Chloroflexi bacterium]|nr:class I SAM-dependent methyltransferase [Chloroflexota bacterium]
MENNIVESCKRRNYDQQSIASWKSHTYRLLLTHQWLHRITDRLPEHAIVFDLGVESVATDLLKTEFPKFQWQNTNWDLRYRWKTEDNSLDLIVCTELLEHLSEPSNEIFNEGFYKKGLRDTLKELFRVLKPGGFFFATTPNVVSVLQLMHILNKRAPWFYDLHVREYTLEEMVSEVTNTGFDIIQAKDVHCMSVYKKENYSSLFEALIAYGYPVDGRGDDLFILAQKPLNSK